MSQTGSNQENKSKSTREMLEEVKQAIHELAVKRVHSYTIGRRQVTYYDLKSLREYKRELEAELVAEQGDGEHMFGTRVSYFDRR